MCIGYSISGGGTNFSSLAGMALETKRLGYHPKYIIGVSAGAILSVPLALHLHGQIQQYATNVTPRDIFKISPVNKKGNISARALLRAASGCPSFGVQDVRPLLSSVVTPDLFKLYQKGDFAKCFILAVNFQTGQRKVFNAKEISYQEYLNAVEASSRIPVMTQPFFMDGVPYYDGGIRDHNAGHLLADLMPDLTHLISFYSRPKDYVVHKDKTTKNIMAVIARTIELLNIEITKNDEYKEQIYCKEKSIKLDQIFSRKRVHYYNTDKKELRTLYNLGRNTAFEHFK